MRVFHGESFYDGLKKLLGGGPEVMHGDGEKFLASCKSGSKTLLAGSGFGAVGTLIGQEVESGAGAAAGARAAGDQMALIR